MANERETGGFQVMKKTVVVILSLMIVSVLGAMGAVIALENEAEFPLPEGWNWWKMREDFKVAVPGELYSCSCGTTAGKDHRHFSDPEYQYSLALISWYRYGGEKLDKWNDPFGTARSAQQGPYLMEDVIAMYREDPSLRLREQPVSEELRKRNAKLFWMDVLNEEGEVSDTRCLLFWEAGDDQGTHAVTFSATDKVFEEKLETVFLPMTRSITRI